eukprot:304569-Rhodomonas_salina.1
MLSRRAESRVPVWGLVSSLKVTRHECRVWGCGIGLVPLCQYAFMLRHTGMLRRGYVRQCTVTRQCLPLAGVRQPGDA